MELEKVTQSVFNRLRTELSPKLSYHSFEHTCDVLDASIRIANEEKLNEYEICLLKTAVLFHDIGFIYQSQNHESKSCEIAQETLPQYKYTTEEIETICGMIMATKIPQVANTKLEKIICDADLDYLGRDDFWKIADNLYHELVSFKIISNENEWNLIQINFLDSHKYFTNYSIKNRTPKKLQHIEIIKLKLN
jgi:predicted metal-dependent HD superfamily phosphohydrolase